MFICRSTFAIVAMLGVSACSIPDALRVPGATPATAHERYARSLVDAGLDSTALGLEWIAASDSALRAPFTATLPTHEVGVYSRSEARAVAYRLRLRDGQRMVATLRADGLPARLFLDLFEHTADTARPFVHRATADTLTPVDSAASMLILTFEAARDGEYILRMQPELLRAGRFELTVRAEPSLAFPVHGRGNRAIQSLFGVARDGGRRAHHGIDIFAPRGTPVIASTDGAVRSTAPNTLGGNVVWLSDDRRNQSLYYAHLESVIVRAGQRVLVGDTLGFVGNSGNARTTPPHLHFGIYRRGSGPIDPLLHVRLNNAPLPSLRADTARLGTLAAMRRPEVALRSAPNADAEIRRAPVRAQEVQIMAASGVYYRVQLEDGTSGYVAASAVANPRLPGR